MSKNITLEQSLQAYRVLNTPAKYSWKKHWVDEEFSDIDLLNCDKIEKKQFAKRLRECEITICDSIKATSGKIYTFVDLIGTIVNIDNKGIAKDRRRVVYSTSNGERPVGKKAFELWNGFQVIDMDIKDENIAKRLKRHIFDKLYKCNWFLGVTLSASGKGLHIYTKIAIPQSEQDDTNKKKLLYLTNFRHKYSFVYLACSSVMEELGFTKEDLLKWMDLAMFKPQQGAFIGYDEHPLISTKFFEDFIYVSFDNVEDIGHPDVDWVTYPDLKEIFKRWEWFEENDDDIEVKVLENPDLEFDTHTKVHYKHFERWRLANTLVKLYGQQKGYNYLRGICSNNIKDKELQADCITAARHQKPIDVWAVNRLNNVHGFKIKLDVQDTSFDESEIFKSMDKINNPCLIRESAHTKTFHIKANEYLGNIRNELLEACERITLIEAGAGVGKTEMVKMLVRSGKKCIMVMPFTSTIKAKVENDDNWYYSYGSRRVRLDSDCMGLSMTIDKFSHMNLMDIKTAGFDYIFIDESHLLFQSEYRPVMPKVIEMIRNTEVPIILMSGTPSGELVFFPDAVHLRVIKEDKRKKEFHVNLVNSTSELMYQMCRQMANDIASGKRILFPTNNGTLYSKQIKAAVTYFLRNEHAWFDEVNLQYYKKSNLGEEFMDDVNFEKTVKDVQILLCSNFLSVGVDILDRLNFSIYFADLMMPQEVEQFANRLRSNDLYIYCFVAKNDAEGNTRSLHKYKEMNFKLNDEEIKNVHSILRLCNAMIERNPIEYKYNSLISSIIHDNKFIEYNEVENKYYLNEIAYKVIYFERKYREYVEQLPVLMQGMKGYGYEVFAKDLGELKMEGSEVFSDLKNMVKLAYDEQLDLNTKHIEELLDLITEERLGIYKEAMNGKYEIRKADEWREDNVKMKMYVKNIEVFEKVVPICTSLSKQYDMDAIRSIFEYCRNKNKTFNFAAIGRIRTLVNIMYNKKNERLDLPIQEYMAEVYEFSDLGTVYKNDIKDFIRRFANKYAQKESTREILILHSLTTMTELVEKFEKIFKCLVKTTHPRKDGKVDMERIELLWKEKEYLDADGINQKVYMINDFLSIIDIDKVDVDEENIDCEVF